MKLPCSGIQSCCRLLLVRSSRVTDHLILRGGAGVDTLSVRKSTVRRDLLLDGGLDKDRFHLWTLDVQHRLSLSDTSGISVIDVSHVTVDGPSYVRTGNSMDFINLDVSTFSCQCCVKGPAILVRF